MKHGEKFVKSPQGKKRKPLLSMSPTSHAESKFEKVQQALINSELRYRRLFETARDGILILDAESGTITDVNPFLIEMLGYSHEEFMEKKLWEVGAFKDIEASRDGFKELQEKEYIRYENMPLKAKDGRLVQVEFVSNVYLVGDKKVIQCNIRDITERRQAEEEIESLAKFPSENPNPVLRLNNDGAILYANESSRALLDDWKCAVGCRVPTKWRNLIRDVLKSRKQRTLDIEVGERVYEYSMIPFCDAGYVNIYGRDITKRKRAEDSLLESEEVFRNFMEHSPIYVFFKDQDIRATRLSRNYETMLGRPLGELLGKNMDDLFPSDFAKSMVADDMRIVKDGRRVECEEEFNGRYYSTIKFPIDFAGKPRSLAGFTIDITDQKRAEKALQESNEILRALVNSSPIAIIALDAEDNVTQWNPAAERMFGWKESEVLGKFLPIVSEDKMDEHRALRKRVLSGEGFNDVEVHRRKKDGSPIEISISTAPLYDSQGQIIGIMSVSADITERKQAEEALKESEDKFSKAFQNSPDIIMISSIDDGKIIEVNASIFRIGGYKREEVIGKTTTDLNLWNNVKDRSNYIEQIRKCGRATNFETNFRKKSGELLASLISGETIRLKDVDYILSTIRDITERKLAERTILNLNHMYKVLSDINQTRIRTTSREHLLQEVCTIAAGPGEFNFAWIGLLDREKQAVVPFAHAGKGKCHRIDAIHSYVLDPDSNGPVAEAIREKKCIALNNISSDHYMQMWKGNLRSCGTHSLAAVPFFFKKEMYGVFVVCSGEIDFFTQEEITLLEEVGSDISFALDSLDERERRRKAVEQLKESEEQYRTLVEKMNDGLGTINDTGIITYSNRRYSEFFGLTPEELVGRNLFDLVDEANRNILKAEQKKRKQGYSSTYEFAITRKDGTTAYALASNSPIYERDGRFYGTLGILTDITEYKRAEEKILYRTNELLALYGLSRSLAEINDLDKILDRVNSQTVENIHVTFARIALLDGGDLVMQAGYPIRILNHILPVGNRVPLDILPLCRHALENNEPVILSSHDEKIGSEEHETLLMDFIESLCLVPLRVGDSPQKSGRIIGLLMLGEARSQLREPFTSDKIRMVRSIGDQAAIAINSAQLHLQTGRRLQHLTALREIDNAIISSFDLHLNLTEVLTHVIEHRGIAAADVLLFNPNSQMLEYGAGLGFRSKNIERAHQHLGEDYAGRAALEVRMVHIPDLAHEQDVFLRKALLAGEEFISYFGVPLVVKGQVKGVMEVFQREQFYPDDEWIDFLNALAGQAAIAIDNATLFNSLQRSNRELTLAYDSTIEGWSHALDLRDNETKGHTLRVAERTVKLAQAFDFSDTDITQIRWGALLHDIGKMGIPDGILFKPGELTEDEWVIMRKHPTFAYEMLSPIRHLYMALDIPYCHHEKWDGTGYPRGLKGEQIPLAARIFAVVDVWDALRSARPYRSPLPDEKVLEYIRSQAGMQFDPKVVEVCFKLHVLEE